MQKLSEIGNLLKKAYRVYSNDLIKQLQDRGHSDLRASFLEILIYIAENDSPKIRSIGDACGLKKQTMTSHLNELEKRGYIIRKIGDLDKREQRVHLTEYGDKFKLTLLEVSSELEKRYLNSTGEVELDRLLLSLSTFYSKISESDQQSLL